VSALEWVSFAVGVLAILGAVVKVIKQVGRLNKEFCGMRDAYQSVARTNVVLLEAMFGVLDGLKQQGCNGKVTETYDMLLKHVVGDKKGGSL
jgi:hypothetical protein